MRSLEVGVHDLAVQSTRIDEREVIRVGGREWAAKRRATCASVSAALFAWNRKFLKMTPRRVEERNFYPQAARTGL